MWSIFSGISASSIIGCVMFTAGIAGMTISCYEAAHHPDLSGILNSYNKRNGAMAAVGAVTLGFMYSQMPEELNNFGYQITNIPPLQLLRGAVPSASEVSSTCSSCLGSIEDMSSSIGNLCSSCVNVSGLGRFGASISSYLPNMPGMPHMPNMPNLSNLGCSSCFGMQSSSLFSGMLVMAVLFLGRGVNLHCDSSIALM